MRWIPSHRALWLILPAVIALLLSAAEPNADSSKIRRVVVIHLDTTRADDIGCNGGIAKTPAIDAVAARGMRYTNSIVTSPKTSPSIATFLTGRVPNQHGVYDVGGALDEKLTSLAEVLKQLGYATAGFTSNPVVGRIDENRRSAGFDQGFDVYETHVAELEVPPGAEPNAVPRSHAPMLVDRALEFVNEHEKEPFFLWMLHLDPHAPYAPPAPFDTMYLEHPDLIADAQQLNAAMIHYQAYVTSRLSSVDYVARHLGAVTMVDHELRRLFDRLEELPGRTLLVITSDHGESLGDLGIWFEHGNNVRYPCVNVPLIVACDGVIPVGVSDALTANIDLAPTVLDLLGVPPKAIGGNGRSLVPTFHDQDPWPDRKIPIQMHKGETWRGVRSSRFCLQSQYEPTSGQHVRSFLYDLENDPRESVDVSVQYPEVFRELFDMERDWFSRPQWTASDMRQDPDMAKQLRSLGYLR